MSWIDGTRARLRLLFAPRASDSRIDQEIRFHLEMETDRLVREERLERAEARRRAVVTFGGVCNHKEALRDGRGLRWMAGTSVDLKLGFRMLIKYPGLTLIGCLAISVAIAVGAGYLELVNKVLNPSLPIADGDRLVGIQNWDTKSGAANDRSLHDFVAWRGALRSVEDLGANGPFDRNLITANGRVEPVEGGAATASMFRLLHLAPVLGRALIDDDERPDAPPVVVLAHSLWQTRFAGDSGVLGRQIRLGNASYTVVGVMPPNYPSGRQLWVPMRVNGSTANRGEGPPIKIFGRLAPGATLETAQLELTTIVQRVRADSPGTTGQLRPVIKPFLEALRSTNGDRAEEIILYSINLFFVALLGVCCANVAALVFARTATREVEITVRTALGASRGRIVSQLFMEALVLVSIAASLGLGGAWLAVRWVKNTIVAVGEPLPPSWSDRFAPATLLYVVALTIVAAAIVGGGPALKATARRLQERLKDAATGNSGMRFGGLWTGVIVTQVALTVVFLLIVGSIGWNAHVGRYLTQLAFPTEKYLSVPIVADWSSPAIGSPEISPAEFRARFQNAYREIERRVSADPRVAGVTFATALPGMVRPRLRVEIEGALPRSDAEQGDGGRSVRTAAVDASFFRIFDRPILAGHDFASGDLAAGRRVAIVDQTFARRMFGSGSALGRRVRQVTSADGEPAGAWYEIRGVVGDFLTVPDSSMAEATIYRLAAAGDAYPINMAVRTKGDPAALKSTVRDIAAAVDPSVRLVDVMPLAETTRGERVVFDIIVRVLAAIAMIALLLSTAGVYALMSFTVARRTREIGIRVALGADQRRVIIGTFGRGLGQVGLGILVGSIPGTALMTFGAGEVAEGAGLLMGAAALAGVAVLMIGVGLFGCFVPVRRALRIQPAQALSAGG